MALVMFTVDSEFEIGTRRISNEEVAVSFWSFRVWKRCTWWWWAEVGILKPHVPG
jgi:hypothetical protein